MVVCPVFGWFAGVVTVFWAVCLICGWFWGCLNGLWVVWIVCGWFRVLQLTFGNTSLAFRNGFPKNFCG